MLGLRPDKIRPRLHHAAPLIEIRRAPVGGTDLFLVGMRERRFAHRVAHAGLSGPDLERRADAMRRAVSSLLFQIGFSRSMISLGLMSATGRLPLLPSY